MFRTTMRIPLHMRPAGRFAPNAFAIIMTGILIYIIYSLLQGLLLGGYLLAQIRPNGGFSEMYDQILRALSTHGAMLMVLFSTAILIVLTLLFAVKMQRQPLRVTGIHRRGWLGHYTLGLGVGFVLVGVFLLAVMLPWPVRYTGLSPIAAAYFFGFAVQAASEEVLFRGYMMPYVAQRVGAFWSVMITSAVFALVHLANGGQSLLSMLAIFSLGAFLALYTLRTGSLFGACAIHAAWNFTVGLVSEISISGAGIDYAAFYIDAPDTTAAYGAVGDPIYLVLIAAMAAAAGVLLFAGKNRLIRRVPHAQWQLDKAQRTASFVLNGLRDIDGKPYLAHAQEVARRVEGEKLQTAAMLQDSCARGKMSPLRLKRRGFDDDICAAVHAMTVVCGETFGARMAMIRANDIARRVKTADIAYSLQVINSLPPSPYLSHIAQGYRAALAALTQ